MFTVDQMSAVSATLAKLKDGPLQQYAAMHKEDPYILSLAMHEMNRRKAARAAQQAQGPQGEQPKVNDQVVAEMAPPRAAPAAPPASPTHPALPEEQGIARLPAGNMNFADGGIVAFAGEGPSLVQDRSSGFASEYLTVPAELAAIGVTAATYKQAADIAARLGTSVPEILKTLGYDATKAAGRGIAGAGRLAVSGPGAAILAGGSQASKFATNVMAANPELRAAYVDNPMLSAMDPDAAMAAAILDQARPAESVAKANAPAAPAAKAPFAVQQSTPTFAGPGDQYTTRMRPEFYSQSEKVTPPSEDPYFKRLLQVSSGPSVPGIEALYAKSQGLANKYLQPELNALGADVKKLGEEGVTAAEEAQRRTNERLDKFANALDPIKQRLEQRQATLDKDKESNVSNAIIQAGLQIMQSRGPLLEAVGKGGQAGMAAYNSGLDRLKNAQERLLDAQDQFTMTKLNRDEFSQKERDAAAQGVKTAQLDARKATLNFGIQSLGMKREEARGFLDSQVRLAGVEAQERGANVRAMASIAAHRNSLEQQVFDAFVQKNKGNKVAAYQEMLSEKREPMQRDLAAKMWTDPIQRQIIQSQNPNIKTFDDYLVALGMTGGGGSGANPFGLKMAPAK